MTLQKNDFIELEFVGRIKGGSVFDTNIKAEAEKANLKIREFRPLALAVGHGLVISGLDKALVGKEIDKNYSAEFSEEEAFGKRNPSLVRMVPLKVFTAQRVAPQKGSTLSLDGMPARIVSVSGGRVLVDFNNPLAGKAVTYDFKVVKKIAELGEKINALQDYFFRTRFDFSEKDLNVVFKMPKFAEPLIKMFETPFKDILSVSISAEILPGKKSEKKNEKAGEKKAAEDNPAKA